jgi:thiosulfate/3-mercaptopyruvate sulfurtransferase
MEHRLSSLTNAIVQPESVISTAEANRLFIDVRLGEPEDEFKSYRDQHIFSAVYAQIREVFASPATQTSGNLPLPSLEALEQQLRQWQVDDDTEIIVYGPSLALAARGWWVLRWAGLSNVRILDGGMKAWTDQGGAVAQGVYAPPERKSSTPLTLKKNSMPSIYVEEMEQLTDDVVLIDARDQASYYAGRIPNAISLPAAEHWTPAAKLRTVQEISQLYRNIGLDEKSSVVVYCGGGVLSALEILTMQALGIRARLYVGSWSEWNKKPERMAISDVQGEQA